MNSGQLFPYDATTILSNNQLIAEQLKHTPAWNILVNVDITSFQYLSAKNDRAQAGAFYTPKEFTDLLLEPTTKEHKTHSRSLNIIQVLFWNVFRCPTSSKKDRYAHSFRCSNFKRCLCHRFRCFSTWLPCYCYRRWL